MARWGRGHADTGRRRNRESPRGRGGPAERKRELRKVKSAAGIRVEGKRDTVYALNMHASKFIAVVRVAA